MRCTTLCYIERGGSYLMLHRVKKEIDPNRGKWIGIGGGMEENESPEDCVRREAMEETGLRLKNPLLRSVVTFVMDGGEGELMFLFTCTDFAGTLREDCDEGVLGWIPKNEVYGLELWEGDRVFLERLAEDAPFFTLKLVYDKNENLTEAILNGTERITPDVPGTR